MITRIVRVVRMQAPVVTRAMAAAVTLGVLGGGLALHAAGIEAFLKIESQTGQEVDTDATHSWVELLGFTQGVESEINIGSTTGAGAGKMQGKTCVLRLAQDRSIASLITACVKGERRHLTLQVVRETSGDFAMMTELHFEDAFVSSVKCEMSEGENQPVFAVGLEYVRLTWTTTWYSNAGPGAGTGTARGAGFDFAENRIFETVSTVPALGDYAEGSGPGPVDPDADHDGMLDAWETANGLNPANAADATQDRDKDGRSNKDEYLAGDEPFFRRVFLPGDREQRDAGIGAAELEQRGGEELQGVGEPGAGQRVYNDRDGERPGGRDGVYGEYGDRELFQGYDGGVRGRDG